MLIPRPLLLAAICLNFSSCVVPDVDGYIDERIEGQKPMPHWNQRGTWHQVMDDPPTYLPTGYSKNRARGESDGVWVIDEREDLQKRLFVPYGGANGFSFDTLEAEARKACRWTPLSPKAKLGWKLVFPI